MSNEQRDRSDNFVDQLLSSTNSLSRQLIQQQIDTLLQNVNRMSSRHNRNDDSANNMDNSSFGIPESRVYRCRRCRKPFHSLSSVCTHASRCRLLHGNASSSASSSQSATGGDRSSPGLAAPVQPAQPNLQQHAFDGFLKVYEYLPDQNSEYDLLAFFSTIQSRLKEALSYELRIKHGVKFYTAVHVKMVKWDMQTGEIADTAEPVFRSQTKVLLNDHMIDQLLDECNFKMFTSYEEFIKTGSNWRIERVLGLELSIAKYAPLAGSMECQVDVPDKLRNTRSIVNVKNSDKLCFSYSVLAYLHPTESNPSRPKAYRKYLPDLNFQGLDPRNMSLDSVPRFEINNELRINVYGYKDGLVYPLYISTRDEANVINLLLLNDKFGQHESGHYVLIKNFSRLMHSQRGVNHHTAKKFCFRCLSAFESDPDLELHMKYCGQFKPERVKMPTSPEETSFEFKNFNHQQRTCLYILADFECLSVKIQSADPSPTRSFTTPRVKYVPCGYAYTRASSDMRYFKKPVAFTGTSDEVMKRFLQDMFAEYEEFSQILKTCEPLRAAPSDWKRFFEADTCGLCLKPLEPHEKCFDHDHYLLERKENDILSNARFATHNSCNLKFRHPTKLCILFHNLISFDSSYVLEAASKYFPEQEIKAISKSSNKFITFDIGPLRFKDSLSFMSGSLEKLVQNLCSNGTDHLKFLPNCYPPQTMHLLTRKQVLCYGYIDRLEVLDEDCLPPKECFFNELTESSISEDDYKHAQTVFRVFEMKSMREYIEFYNCIDCILLAEVVENLRDVCMRDYKLDPLHYVTMNQMTLDNALRFTGAKLELIDDATKYYMFEKSVLGGVSYIGSVRCAMSNNELSPTFDSSKQKTYFRFLDANGLYSYVMSRYKLPQGGFEWMTRVELENFDPVSVDLESDTGYLLEADLEIPEDMHEKFDLFPLCPEKVEIKLEDLSPYTKRVAKSLKIKNRQLGERLVSSLSDKKNYVIHSAYLQFCIKHGIVLKKLHAGIKFKQSRFLADYINFNAEKRRSATNALEKQHYKSLNNSCYGTLLMNVRKFKNVKIVQNGARLQGLVSSPNFESFDIFRENFVVVRMKREEVHLKRPIAVGASVLWLSKLVMAEFHYETVLPAFGSGNVDLCLTDTDSFLYLFKVGGNSPVKDIDQFFLENKQQFDFSTLSPDHVLYDNSREGVLGLFKFETGPREIESFVGLSSKTYSIRFADYTVKTGCKGVPKKTVETQLRHDDYLDCLLKSEEKYAHYSSIRKIGLDNFQLFQNRVGLTPFDTKRYIYGPNGIFSLAFSNIKIARLREIEASEDREGQ